MDEEVRKSILGTVFRMLWGGEAWRGEGLKGLLCPILWFQLQLCWGVLCTRGACYFQGLTYLCFSVSGHICRLALKFRRVSTPGATISTDGRRIKGIQTDPTSCRGKAQRLLLYPWFCKTAPAALSSVTHSGNQHTGSPVITFSSFPGSLFQPS